MFRKSILTGLTTLAGLVAAPAQAEDVDVHGYFNILYAMRPMPGCPPPDVYSTEAYFYIADGKVSGAQTEASGPDDLELVPLTETPYAFAPKLDYSWACGVCVETGTYYFPEIRGEVKTIGGKKSLHLFLSHVRAVCSNTCMFPTKDCSDPEVVVDEIVIPYQDGYILDRGPNVIFKYGLHLE